MRLAIIVLLIMIASPVSADDLDAAQSTCNENRDTEKFGVDRWKPGFEKCADVLDQFNARETKNTEDFLIMREKAKTYDRANSGGRAKVDEVARQKK